jgi:hypothetical protein
VTDGYFFIAFFTFYNFLSVKNMLWAKKIKFFGVKQIHSLIYFIYAESKNNSQREYSFKNLTVQVAGKNKITIVISPLTMTAKTFFMCSLLKLFV